MAISKVKNTFKKIRFPKPKEAVFNSLLIFGVALITSLLIAFYNMGLEKLLNLIM